MRLLQSHYQDISIVTSYNNIIGTPNMFLKKQIHRSVYYCDHVPSTKRVRTYVVGTRRNVK